MRTIIILFLAFLSLSVNAQTKRVLVNAMYPYFGFHSHVDSLINAVKLHYHDSIDVVIGELPNQIDFYDAIFAESRQFTVPEEASLQAYLDNGGRLYLEGERFNYSTQLGYAIGDTAEAALSSTLRVDSAFGVSSSFTEGLKYFVSHKNPAEYDAAEILTIRGDAKPILTTDWNYGLAYQYEKDNYKVILHWKVVHDYYNDFVGRVACNYFNLCTPLSVDKNQSAPLLQLANPSYNKELKELHFRYNLPLAMKFDISVYNILGERVYYSYHNDAGSTSGEMRIRLNSGLTSGGYFLVVKPREGVARKPFFVIN